MGVAAVRVEVGAREEEEEEEEEEEGEEEEEEEERTWGCAVRCVNGAGLAA